MEKYRDKLTFVPRNKFIADTLMDIENKPKDRFIYIKLIGILVIPLIFITYYSFSDTEIGIGEFILQKADIKSHFTRKDITPVVVTDTLTTDSVEVVPEQIIVNDTTSQRILFFGDSMVEGLSKRMRQYAAANNHELLNIIWYSSSTKIWSESDTLNHFLKQFEPTYIMVCMGGNELFVRDLDKRNNYIKNIVRQISDKPYIWIGPPNWKEDTGINNLIEENVETFRFFPSKNLTYERSKDGAHPTFASAAKWMDSIAVWMNDETHYRIRMDFPQSAEQKGKTIMLQPLR